MPIYIMLAKFTNDGRKSIVNNPGKIMEINQELEDVGAKIITQYALLGNYDLVNIFEAHSNEVIARVSAKFGSLGIVEPTTMVAISMHDYVRELGGAKIITE